jgi:hypothetical protein
MPTRNLYVRRLYIGFVLACLCGIAGLASIMFAPANSVLALFTLVILPVALTFLLTGRLTDALALAWVNEMFFGGSGLWIQVGPLSGRWMLLVILAILSAVYVFLPRETRSNKSHPKRPLFMQTIILYGAVLPLWLVFYSVVVQGTLFWTAVADVNFLFALLVYFPLRRLLYRQFDLFRGWIVGNVFVLGGVFFLLAFLPNHVATSMFSALAGSQTPLGAASGINRAALLVQVLLFLGVFLGGLYALDRRQRGLNRLAGFALSCTSIAVFVLFFLRGPLLSLVIVAVAFLLAASQRGETRPMARRLWATLVFVVVCAFVFYSFALPEAIEKFTIDKGGVSAFVSEVRVEQSSRLLAAFLQKPLWGQGVGVPPDEQGGLDFELQYNMLLYRLGLVNFVVLLAPIVWLFREPFRILRSERSILYRRDGKFMLAVLLSLLTTLIAGSMNPYLTAIYTPFFVILYLSCREIAAVSSDTQDRGSTAM